MMDALMDLEHFMTQNAALSKANLKLNVFNSLVRQYRDFTNRSDRHQQHLTLDLASMILMKNHHTKNHRKRFAFMLTKELIISRKFSLSFKARRLRRFHQRLLRILRFRLRRRELTYHRLLTQKPRRFLKSWDIINIMSIFRLLRINSELNRL